MLGSVPEESPEKMTGIVLCDLIDCANNSREFTIIPARLVCQKFFKNILDLLHLYRQNALLDATSAIANPLNIKLSVSIGYSTRDASPVGGAGNMGREPAMFSGAVRR